MGLKLYNSLTRRLEEFKPINDGRVGIYVCGPTVYGHAHLGHAKSYVSFDILVRYLRYLGYNVTYVQNITDAQALEPKPAAGDPGSFRRQGLSLQPAVPAQGDLLERAVARPRPGSAV